MSKYTTQVRNIVEYNSLDMEGQPITERIMASLPKIFNFYYPMYEESYRKNLEKKIIMHYFNKEIGLETVGLWQFYLEEKLNLIMPKYIEIYKTTNFDYLLTINETESYESDKNYEGNVTDLGNSKTIDIGNDLITTSADLNGNTNGDTTSKGYVSDFPQGNINGVDYATTGQDLTGTSSQTDTQHTSSTNTTDRNNDVTTTSSNNQNRTDLTSEKYSRNRKGFSGKSMTELNIEYRNSIINIDNMIISELSDLFMTIY